MTNEENKRRASDANVRYIKDHICDHTGNKSYVFISYKSDDWETVLHDIVYRLVSDYGLNVYFDGDFDSHNSLWIDQFPRNMGDYKCKGVIAFLDDRYATSYATLMELLFSQTKKASIGKSDPNGLPIVPINLEKMTNIMGHSGEKDTGLGLKTYEDGSVNVNADNEKKMFSKYFKELTDRDILRDAKYLWDSDDKLKAATCSQIVQELVAYKKINENHYSAGMSLQGIVDSIKNACGSDVFDTVIETFEYYVTVVNGDSKKTFRVKKGNNVPKQDPGIRGGFEFEGWFVSGTDEEWDFSNPIHGDIEIYAKWKKNPVVFDYYEYSLWGISHRSEKLVDLINDVFDLIAEKYPDKVPDIAVSLKLNAVARKDDLDQGKVDDSRARQFKHYKAREHTVNGIIYCVNAGYNYETALKHIKNMLVVCEGNSDGFTITKEKKKTAHSGNKNRKHDLGELINQ